MTDINTLVDNIILSRAAAEDNARARRSAIAKKVLVILDITAPFLIAGLLLAAGFIIAVCI